MITKNDIDEFFNYPVLTSLVNKERYWLYTTKASLQILLDNDTNKIRCLTIRKGYFKVSFYEDNGHKNIYIFKNDNLYNEILAYIMEDKLTS